MSKFEKISAAALKLWLNLKGVKYGKWHYKN